MKSQTQQKLYDMQAEELVDGELIDHRAAVVAACAFIAAAGVPAICTRCQDCDEPIAAVLLLEADERAWLLCGPCRRRLPCAGIVA